MLSAELLHSRLQGDSWNRNGKQECCSALYRHCSFSAAVHAFSPFKSPLRVSSQLRPPLQQWERAGAECSAGEPQGSKGTGKHGASTAAL